MAKKKFLDYLLTQKIFLDLLLVKKKILDLLLVKILTFDAKRLNVNKNKILICFVRILTRLGSSLPLVTFFSLCLCSIYISIKYICKYTDNHERRNDII